MQLPSSSGRGCSRRRLNHLPSERGGVVTGRREHEQPSVGCSARRPPQLYIRTGVNCGGWARQRHAGVVCVVAGDTVG